MLFGEKLDFLLKLTDTTNKQLAVAISVDPSLISRMRTGKRSVSKPNNYLTVMCDYFAKKCTTDYQRIALSETIGQKQIKLIMKKELLSEIIYRWLLDTSPTAFMNMTRAINDKMCSDDMIKKPKDDNTPVYFGKKSSCYIYYGNNGKRQALHNMAMHLQGYGSPCEILVSTDESLEWMSESPEYLLQQQADLINLTNAGYSFRRIAPKYSDISDAVSSFTRWIQIYMRGKMDTYYYPRIRDNVYHRTIVVAPGTIAICSSSVGYHDSDITFLYTDLDAVNNAAADFEDYFKKCVPMTITHTHNDKGKSIVECLQDYLDIPGNMATKFYGLPALVTPPCIIKKIFGDDKKTIEAFKQLDQKCNIRLAKEKLTDIITLAEPNDVRDGKVLCTTSLLVPGVQPYFYTVQEYIEHLKGVISLMEEYPDYTVIIYKDENDMHSTICTIESGKCYMIRMEEPVTLFEISDQNIVASAKDYVLHLVEFGRGNRSGQRTKTINQIQQLITTLENM